MDKHPGLVRARAEAETALVRMEQSGNSQRAAAARLIRQVGFAFEDALNAEIVRAQDGTLAEADLFVVATRVLATHLGHIIDHYVVRGIPRSKAVDVVSNSFMAMLLQMESHKEADLYVPDAFGGSTAGFDFRSMLKGE